LNYLAHARLAHDSPEGLVGNLMADFVRGKVEEMTHLSPGVRSGILLHRAIDQFTDSHPVFHRSVGRISARWHHYSPVLIDVFYDHFLASDWPRYFAEPLEAFAQRVYEVMQSFHHQLPEPMQEAMLRMRRQNWFLSYATREGIGRALQKLEVRIWHRSERVSQLEQALVDLDQHYGDLARDFQAFFPQLQAHVEEAKSAMPQA
jgi:acyl carrier protein phosphodiesterase